MWALGVYCVIVDRQCTCDPPFQAVCQSRRLWQARHTGIKIVQQIAILMGCAVLPHLKHLVDIISHGLEDEQPKVKTITALAIAALAEASHPYGIDSFDNVLRPLWKGIIQMSGKSLAAYLKAIGFLIPLMDAEYASYYTENVMPVLIREFSSPDEEMKKIVLKVVMQCVGTDGVEADYVRKEILPEFMKCFWVRRNALDRRNYRALVSCTVEVANKVGVTDIVGAIVSDLKDESEPYVGPSVFCFVFFFAFCFGFVYLVVAVLLLLTHPFVLTFLVVRCGVACLLRAACCIRRHCCWLFAVVWCKQIPPHGHGNHPEDRPKPWCQ